MRSGLESIRIGINEKIMNLVYTMNGELSTTLSQFDHLPLGFAEETNRNFLFFA